MGHLDQLQAQLAKKKQDARTGGDANLQALQTLNGLVDGLSSPSVKPERFEDVSKQIARGIKRLFDQLAKAQDSITNEISKRPTSHAPMIDALSEVSNKIDGFVDAISKIEIPAPVVEAQPAPDLSSIDARMNDIERNVITAISHIKVSVPETKEREAETWHVNAERNSSGHLKFPIAIVKQ